MSLVTFEAGSQLTSIGDYAFQESGLTSITIPAGVTNIGTYAFSTALSLASVIFERNSQLTTIETYAFFGASRLTLIRIPAGVNSIGYNAFANTILSTVYIEDDQVNNISSPAEGVEFSGARNVTVLLPIPTSIFTYSWLC